MLYDRHAADARRNRHRTVPTSEEADRGLSQASARGIQREAAVRSAPRTSPAACNAFGVIDEGAGIDEAGERLLLEAEAARDRGDLEGQRRALDVIFARWGDSAVPTARVVVGQALYQRAGLLGDAGDRAGAVSLLLHAYERLTSEGTDEDAPGVIETLYALAHYYLLLEHFDEAVRWSDRLIDTYGAGEGDELVLVGAALLVKASAVLSRGVDQSLRVWEEIPARFAGAQLPELRLLAARADVERMRLLRENARVGEAVPIAEELCDRIQHEPDDGTAIQVGEVLLGAGALLVPDRGVRLRPPADAQRGQAKAAEQLLNAVIVRLREVALPAARPVVAQAEKLNAITFGRVGRLRDSYRAEKRARDERDA